MSSEIFLKASYFIIAIASLCAWTGLAIKGEKGLFLAGVGMSLVVVGLAFLYISCKLEDLE